MCAAQYILRNPRLVHKMRGVCHRGLPPELVVRRRGVSPRPPAKLPSKRWRDLIVAEHLGAFVGDGLGDGREEVGGVKASKLRLILALRAPAISRQCWGISLGVREELWYYGNVPH
jgi:hypothetical protein